MLDSLIGELSAEGVGIERAAIEGGPARVLVEAAEGADLLVVGSRGHGGFTGLLLGSVSQQCSRHAELTRGADGFPSSTTASSSGS